MMTTLWQNFQVAAMEDEMEEVFRKKVGNIIENNKIIADIHPHKTTYVNFPLFSIAFYIC